MKFIENVSRKKKNNDDDDDVDDKYINWIINEIGLTIRLKRELENTFKDIIMKNKKSCDKVQRHALWHLRTLDLLVDFIL